MGDPNCEIDILGPTDPRIRREKSGNAPCQSCEGQGERGQHSSNIEQESQDETSQDSENQLWHIDQPH